MLSLTSRLLRSIVLVGLFLTPWTGMARDTVNLDGVWSFATDPGNRGEAEKWYQPAAKLPTMPLPGYAPEANGQIRVPGIWDNQGYGTETDKVRHNFVGKGWYKRTVDIPRTWAGQRVFLTITGVSRSAKVWIDETYLGEHVGFVSAFEWDVTEYAVPERTITLTIQVDSEQHWEVDSLYGVCSLSDYMDVPWGGIWGHVRLESRPNAWISDLYVQPDVPTSACSASVTINGKGESADAVRLEVFDKQDKLVAENTAKLDSQATSGQPISLRASISDAELWTPDRPTLYRARFSLLQAGRVLDSLESRFGMRQFTRDGYRLLLNGTPLMLRGFGDDHVYPEQMAMPSDKELHLSRLRVIKSYGFNHVRHHSTMMPAEYYDACDEIGMITTAEFPICYSFHLPGTGQVWLEKVKPGTDPTAAIETHKREWSAAVKQHRNHPSILCWVMGNELYGGIPLRLDFQREKNRLDPSRWFVDSDGVWGFDVSDAVAKLVPPGAAVNVLDGKNDRDTLDLHFLQFFDPVTGGLVYPTTPLNKPAIIHETGNHLTFPRPDLIDQFRHNIKPFWLVAGKEKLKKLGLDEEATQWAEKSERLYSHLHKRNIEAIRKVRYFSGYHWWLFQDYWTTSNGLVDHYFRPKSISRDEVLKYNNGVVLLQDGLEQTYRGHGKLMVKPIVSNFAAGAIRGDMTWEIRLGTNVLVRKAIPLQVPQGEVQSADAVELELPDVAEPTPLKIVATLASGGTSYCNDWSARVYPATIRPVESSVPLFVAEACKSDFADWITTAIPAEGRLAEHAVYATEDLSDPRILDAMDRGASVILFGPQKELGAFRKVTFATSWWKAGDSAGRNHTGTFVYDHPVTRAMAPDGWCDEGWYELLEGGGKYVLENVPSRPNMMIRALSSMVRLEESSLLFEVGVGKGCLIASGLNHRRAAGRPENQWLLARMLDHAAAMPRPKENWPISFLAKGPKPPLVKLPVNFGHIAECTPVLFGGRPLLVLNYHDDTLVNMDERVKAMHLCVQDLTTGQEIARFGEGHTFVSAFVEGPVMHVFASEERKKDIHHFTSTDLKTWKRTLAIPRDGDELLYNCSVCTDDQGYLMAYEADKPVQFCIKFARSNDLETWNKIDGLAFAGVEGKQYSACPVVRYFKPYYYVIYLHEAIPGHNGWVPFLARSKDLVKWQLSPMNPILEAGPGEGCNNSDVDLFEQDGNTYFYYANGDQATWYSLRMAMYPGTMKIFYETCFPDGQPMTEISARRAEPVRAPQ